LPIRRLYLGVGAARRNAGFVYHFGRDWNLKMTSFDKREEGFEKKYASTRSRNSRPRRAATSCSVCGSEKLGIGATPPILRQGSGCRRFREAATATSCARCWATSTAKGAAITEAEIRIKMDQLMAQAVAQVKAGRKRLSLAAIVIACASSQIR